MAKAVIVVRILLGFGFLFFGLNILLHFLHTPTPPGDAGVFATVLATHGYMTFIGLCQVIGGLLLLVGRYVPLGLTILAPIIVNILLFHLTLLGGVGIAPGLLCAALEIFLIWAYRRSFLPLLAASPEVA